MKNCKNCGAAAPNGTSLHSFVCEFCGTKNVDEEYFKELARNSDLGKSNRFMQLGLNSFESDEFIDAEKHFESSIIEDDKNPEVWIYLALCKANLISASNFDKTIKSVKDAIYRASSIDDSSEIVTLGKIALANCLVTKIQNISGHYFDTADKTFVAYGGDKNAAVAASNDLISGLKKIQSLQSYQISADVEYTELLVSALVKSKSYELKGVLSPELLGHIQYLMTTLLDIYDRNQEVVKLEISSWGDNASSVIKLINENRPNNKLIEPKSTTKGFFSKFFS
jgi:hypothetical protein